MKKIKNMLKKGGIADIITLMIIIGLVIALIIAVVLPLVNKSKDTAKVNSASMDAVSNSITDLSTPI